jgi:hypothetical protein
MLSTFKSHRSSAAQHAIRHVNGFLRAGNYRTIATLSELSYFHSVPRKPVPTFTNNDEVLALLVNAILAEAEIPAHPNPVEPGYTSVLSPDLLPSELNSITGHIELGDWLRGFTQPPVSCLRHLTTIGLCIWVDTVVLDSVMSHLVDEIAYPIEPNVPGETTADSIIPVDFLTDLSPFASADVSALSGISRIDSARFVNNSVVDGILASIVDTIPIPIVPNVFEEGTEMQILSADPFTDSCSQLRAPRAGIRPLEIFSASDDQFCINHSSVVHFLDSVFDGYRIPVIPNVVTNAIVQRIFSDDFSELLIPLSHPPLESLMEHEGRVVIDRAVFNAFFEGSLDFSIDRLPVVENGLHGGIVDGIMQVLFVPEFAEVLPLDKLEYLHEFELVDEVAIGDQRTGAIVLDGIFDRSKLPIVPNECEEDAIGDIVAEFVDSAMDASPVANVHFWFFDLDRKSENCFVDDRAALATLDELFEERELPIEPNNPDDDTLAAILEDDLIGVFWSVFGDDSESVRHYEVRDPQYLVSDRFTIAVVDRSLDVDVERLPVEPNAVSESVLDALVNVNYLTDLSEFAEYDFSFIRSVERDNRRIDFNFPMTVDSIFPASLPVARNECVDEVAELIVDVVAGFEFYDMPIGDTRIFSEYIAPDEHDESLQELAERLTRIILKDETLIDLPFEEDIQISDQLAESIFDLMFKPKRAFAKVPLIDVSPLRDVAQKEIPTTVTPDEVTRMVMSEILELIPLVAGSPLKAAFGRFLDDLMDGDEV